MSRLFPLCCISAVLFASVVEASTRGDGVRRNNDIVYARRGDLELKLDAYLPQGKGPFPAVLVVHGGAWRFGTRKQLALQARKFAENGMAAFAITYRLAPQHKFPAQIHDCKEAVRFIRHHARKFDLDQRRVGGFGYSAGAHLVALLAVTGPDKKLEGETALPDIDTSLTCVCAGGTPSNFDVFPSDARMLSYWLGGSRNQVPKLYHEASPTSHVTASAPPMFFFHGERDRLVDLGNVQLLVERLKENQVETELLVLKGMGHTFAAVHPRGTQESVEFFKKHFGLKAEAE